MPLPPASPREEMHLRRIELRGFRRADGLFDIEARMDDTKQEPLRLDNGRVVPPAEPVHEMAVRLVVDADLRVVDVMACTDAAPYGVCREAPGTLDVIKGLRIGPGWSRAVRERLSGHRGCTHHTELLGPLATVAFQTLWQVRRAKAQAGNGLGKPAKIDSCYAYASHRELVRERWPMYFQDAPAVVTTGS
jgi:hypothetical protein